jgi:hypothetical protein
MFCHSNTTEPKVYMYIAVAYNFLPKSVDPPLGDAVDIQSRQTVRTSRGGSCWILLNLRSPRDQANGEVTTTY